MAAVCLGAGLATTAATGQRAAAGACEPGAPSSQTYTTESIRFLSEGGVHLAACLYRPKGRDRFPVVVMVTGSGDEPRADGDYTIVHARAFAARGIGVFAFDKRGVGNSEGLKTGTDFRQRAADVAAAVDFLSTLPATTQVALWGVSQAGWVIPQALRPKDGVAFVILVSPAGVNPHEQMSFFIRNLALRLGCSPEEAVRAETIHRTVVPYYATGQGYRAAQDLVDRFKREPWFERFRTNPVWDERIGPGGRLMTPKELARAWKKNPASLEFYRAPSIFADYTGIYQRLDRPTLIVHGSADTLVSVQDSDAAFAAAFRKSVNPAVEFKVFEGAGHGVHDDDGTVRSAYLEFIAAWAARHFQRTH